MSVGPLICLSAVTVLAACRPERPPAEIAQAAPVRRDITYTAEDFQFSGPRRLAAGPTTLHLVNHGQEVHHLIVVRLGDGRTFDSLTAALKHPGPPPGWMHPVGGPNGAAPGATATASLDLTPGDYALLCVVPTTGGVPHFAKGMVSPLEVTAPTPAAPLPPADLTLDLTDYAFAESSPLSPGHQVIRVENRGQQLHEAVLVRLADGKEARDMAVWELGGRKGTAPGSYLSGMAPLGPGDAAQFEVTLEPGRYGLICFVPDAKDGKPHTAHGMVRTITVG